MEKTFTRSSDPPISDSSLLHMLEALKEDLSDFGEALLESINYIGSNEWCKANCREVV